MSGCGYVCPKCEGKGVDDNLQPCWCSTPLNTLPEITEEEWMKTVHEGPCCSDLSTEQTTDYSHK